MTTAAAAVNTCSRNSDNDNNVLVRLQIPLSEPSCINQPAVESPAASTFACVHTGIANHLTFPDHAKGWSVFLYPIKFT